MNLLNKITIRSLKLNRKRTIVTAIGIILSVALITAVTGIFMSFQESIIQDVMARSGRYHTMFRGVDLSVVNVVRNNRDVGRLFLYRTSTDLQNLIP